MTRHAAVIVTASLAAVLSVFSPALVARADIFQWEYINPADPGQGKQQSATLAPDGAGVNAAPGAILWTRNLTMAYLIGADLTGAYAYSANLADAELSQANLTNAQLGAYVLADGTGWDGAFLGGANLTQANLTNADFSGYYAYNADAPDPVNNSIYYSGASLLDANLTGAEVRGANFYGSLITLAQLYSTGSYQTHDLTGIRLPGHNLAGANLAGQNLTDADFSGFQISSFHEFYSTDLTAANLTNADFARARLDGANLSGADARGANFQYASLFGANTANLIQSDGHIAGLDLTAGASLVVRDYDGNPSASPPAGPRPIIVDDHVAMDATGALRLVFDADAWDSTISFAPGIPVALGGTLELSFAPGVNLASQSGRTIDLFDWTGVTPTGAFNVSSPYAWDLSRLYTTGEVTLTAAGGLVLGDFNGDSVVDGSDLANWKAGFGASGMATRTQGDADGDADIDGADFLAWQRQVGSTTTVAATAAVPEPATLLLLLPGALTMFRRRGGV
ncbi:MAG: pentapeptide repeat-containing protein [Pirellulales bacterium]|nr:pentapeptide repeat-containing protein [Pirellulales bacterium]